VQLGCILHYETNIIQGGNKYVFCRNENIIQPYGNDKCEFNFEETSNSYYFLPPFIYYAARLSKLMMFFLKHKHLRGLYSLQSSVITHSYYQLSLLLH